MLDHVMHVDEGGVGAARHAAATSIAGEHGATECGRDGLLGAVRVSDAAPTWAWSELSSVALRVLAPALGRATMHAFSYAARRAGAAGLGGGGQELAKGLGVALGHADDSGIDGHEVAGC